MKFSAKASSALTHHAVLTHGSINKDDHYTAHFQPGWIRRELNPGRLNHCSERRTGRRVCLLDEVFTALHVMRYKPQMKLEDCYISHTQAAPLMGLLWDVMKI